MTDPARTLADRVVLVTGASRGIGYAAALEAARRGAHVIAIARTVGGLEDLDDAIAAVGGSATLVPLDLLDFDAIDRLGAALFERWQRLDGLVGNAGMLGVLSPLPHIAPKDFTKIFGLNVTANYRLIRSMDLLLRQSNAGRAVFLSSSAAHSAKPYWGAYAASKAALEALAKSYAGETAHTAVRCNVFLPGAVRTAMRAKAMPGENPETLPTPADVAGPLVDMIEPRYDRTGQVFDIRSGETRAL
ncbi:Short-chain dehydrogenase [Devosia enhydra]|uniref:Short-chain dehydrogenase n=1 Tax=Devosia enhydra TaxID=665118 RepID=A0A1K2HTN6_9HYPH|nr:SDR family NAD(P)-dependent oxidoreductase [Devosia enhydra]SFZ81573.1 Short-chain dehydrogenase [Devosia enhydra]